MDRKLLLSLLGIGAVAFACGPRGKSELSGAPADTVPLKTVSAKPPVSRPAPRSKGKPGPQIDSKLEVTVTKARNVRLALDVRNVGTKHAEITFPSGQAYDFVVVDSTGREIWRWSDRRMFTSGVQKRDLAAGDSMQLAERWTDAQPGHYTAIAVLKSSNYPVEERIDFVMQ